jgi:acetyl esterase/lipase
MVLRDLAYVPNGHAHQKLDIYLPPTTRETQTKRYPLLVYVHGGAFMFGDKNSAFLPVRMLSQGYALASLDYRLSGDALFPAQIEDCKGAVRWLRAHAAQYYLDDDCFVAWGESAGGNLAALLGTTGQTKSLDVGPNLEYSSAVQGMVDYYGPTDFLQMDAHRVAGGDQHDPTSSPESRLIGGAIQENKEKVEKANPITYVSDETPPFSSRTAPMTASCRITKASCWLRP